MKKVILSLACAMASAVCFAQSAPAGIDTSKVSAKAKQGYQPDPSKLYTVTLRLTAQQVGLLVMSPEEWKAFKHSSNFNGEQISASEDMADAIRKNVIDQVNRQQIDDYNQYKAAGKAKH